jgi:hypothetical protein
LFFQDLLFMNQRHGIFFLSIIPDIWSLHLE